VSGSVDACSRGRAGTQGACWAAGARPASKRSGRVDRVDPVAPIPATSPTRRSCLQSARRSGVRLSGGVAASAANQAPADLPASDAAVVTPHGLQVLGLGGGPLRSGAYARGETLARRRRSSRSVRRANALVRCVGRWTTNGIVRHRGRLRVPVGECDHWPMLTLAAAASNPAPGFGVTEDRGLDYEHSAIQQIAHPSECIAAGSRPAPLPLYRVAASWERAGGRSAQPARV
jgi:hypothetical protein